MAAGLSSKSGTSIVGELLILIAAICWALGIILMKRLPKISPFLAIRNIFGIGMVPLILLALFLEQPWAHTIQADSVYALLGPGIVCAGIAYAAYLYLIMRTSPTFSSLAGNLVILFGVLYSIGFMGDTFDTNDLVAILLIIAAPVIARFSEKGSTSRAS